MRLHLIAPLRVPYGIAETSWRSDLGAYVRAWSHVRTEILRTPSADYKEVAFLHASTKSDVRKYQVIHEAGSRLPTRSLIISFHTTDADNAMLMQQAKACHIEQHVHDASAESFLIHLYDNTIAVAELNCSLSSTPRTFDKELSKPLQEWTNVVMDYFLHRHYKAIESLISDIYSVASDFPIIETPGDHPVFPTSKHNTRSDNGSICGQVLWVNRTVILDQAEPVSDASQFLLTWMPEHSVADTDITRLLDSKGIVIGWGHNVVTNAVDHDCVKSAFASLRMAQYFYTLFDVFNDRLLEELGKSMVDQKRTSLRNRRLRLSTIVRSIALELIDLNDVLRNVQGVQRELTTQCLERFSFDKLIQSVREKQTLCENELNNILATVQRRWQQGVQVLLGAIGVMAVINLGSGLIKTAHTQWVPADRALANDGIHGALSIIRLIGADTIVSSSIILAMALAALAIVAVAKSGGHK